MSKLIGTIRDTSGTGVTGFLIVRLNAPLIDISTTPESVRYTKETRYEITLGDLATPKINGVAQPGGIELLPTIPPEPTYQFSFIYPTTTQEFYLNGVLYLGDRVFHNSAWYTGAVYNSGTSVLLVLFNRVANVPLFEPFNAHIPASTTVEFSNLQHSSINFSNIDTSLYYIASLMSQGQNLINLLNGLFTPKGTWLAATVYNRGDVIFYPSTLGSYWYINAASTAGNLPTDTIFWQELIRNTNTGGGGTVDPATIFLNTAMSATWDGITDKGATANTLYNTFQLYAKLTDATFASLKAPTKQAGTNTTDVATTAFIQAALTGFTAPPATTAINIEPSDRSSKIVNSNTLKSVVRRYGKITEEQVSGSPGGVGSSSKNRYLEFIKHNNTIDLAGTQNLIRAANGTVILYAGSYQFRGVAIAVGTGQSRLYLTINSVVTHLGLSVDCALGGYQISYVPSTILEVSGEFTIGSESNVNLQQRMQTVGDSVDMGKPSNRGGNEVYASLELWKID